PVVGNELLLPLISGLSNSLGPPIREKLLLQRLCPLLGDIVGLPQLLVDALLLRVGLVIDSSLPLVQQLEMVIVEIVLCHRLKSLLRPCRVLPTRSFAARSQAVRVRPAARTLACDAVDAGAPVHVRPRTRRCAAATGWSSSESTASRLYRMTPSGNPDPVPSRQQAGPPCVPHSPAPCPTAKAWLGRCTTGPNGSGRFRPGRGATGSGHSAVSKPHPVHLPIAVCSCDPGIESPRHRRNSWSVL